MGEELLLQDNFMSGLIRALKFNRFLALVIALNLLFYSSVAGWVSVITYASLTEIFIRICQNRALSSKKVCNNFLSLNIILTTIFLLMIAAVSGNKDFIFLCAIPVFQAILFKKPFLMNGIIGAASACVFAATFSVHQLMSFITVIGLLTFLGIALSKIFNRTHSKADYLHSIATTDALTGLINRREFDRRITEEFSRAKRHKSPLSLALFDIDFFKKINDTYGHNTGDIILRELAGLISSNTRSCDIAARYGGEEFALILPETSQVKAYELMDRLRQMVEKELFNKTRRPIRFTISIGVAQLDLTDSTPVDLVERTDKALYKAKQEGRNRVERAPFGFHFVTQKKEAV